MSTGVSRGVTSAELDENVTLLQTPTPGSLWDELRSEGLLVEVESIAV